MSDTTLRDRLARVRSEFDRLGIDGLLVSSPHNRRWLSGFSGSAGDLLVTRDDALLITDSRYWERCRQEAPHFRLWKQGSKRLADQHAGILACGAKRIGVEAHQTTLKTFEALRSLEGIEWVQLDPVIEPLRAVKTGDEVSTTRHAAKIADGAMALFPQLARPGVSERELAWQLERAMREAGADGVAFEIIVASGPNAALPHHHPGDRLLEPGDSIVVDMGAMIDGYRSDLTRSYFLGQEPSSKFVEVYETTRQAQEAAIAAVSPGVAGREVDAIARTVIGDAGYGEFFGHGLGHGVGLEIHEEPRLSSQGADGALEPGMIVTVEPGIYLPGWGGVRIEDLILVTETGCESLSSAPKVPLIPVT